LNCAEDTETPVTFNVAEPVLVRTKDFPELVVFCMTEPNAREPVESLPCAAV
jgi:hypothetical protein